VTHPRDVHSTATAALTTSKSARALRHPLPRPPLRPPLHQHQGLECLGMCNGFSKMVHPVLQVSVSIPLGQWSTVEHCIFCPPTLQRDGPPWLLIPRKDQKSGDIPRQIPQALLLLLYTTEACSMLQILACSRMHIQHRSQRQGKYVCTALTLTPVLCSEAH
jgi:hypothetical protein